MTIKSKKIFYFALVNPMKTMWTKSPETRQRNGHALCNLSLKSVLAESDDVYLHEFITTDVDLMNSNFEVGNYLIVSSSTRLSVAAGRVVSINENSIQLALERFV